MYMLFMNEKLTRGSIFYENCHFAKQTKFSSAFICSIILALYCFKKVGEKLSYYWRNLDSSNQRVRYSLKFLTLGLDKVYPKL